MRRIQLVSAAANELRDRHYVLDPATGLYVRTVLLEPAATNLLLHSCDLSAGQGVWGGASNFSVSAATSIFAGQTAWRHQNLGTAAFARRQQALGTLTGQPETASLIVENVDAIESLLSIFDGTAGVHVGQARLDWASGVASVSAGSGTARARRLADSGPNGGPVYRLSITTAGTAGNERQIRPYPTGASQNTQTAIIHHVQHEVGAVATSPIVTTTAAVTRAADALTFPWLHPPQAMTGYLRFVELGAVQYPNSRTLLQIGSAGNPPRLFVFQNAGAGRYGMRLAGAANNADSTLPTSPVPAIGDRVELLWRLYADGSVQIEQSINAGAPVVAARSAAIGMPPAWSGQVLGLSCVPGFSGDQAPAAWLGWAIEVGSSDATWDYMRAAVGW